MSITTALENGPSIPPPPHPFKNHLEITMFVILHLDIHQRKKISIELKFC